LNLDKREITKSIQLEDVECSEQPPPLMNFFVYDDAWVGRESLIQQLSDRVHSSCRVLLLVGITGIGKTALAERVVEELRGDWREHRDNFEDERKASDFASVALQWLEKWGETVLNEERKPEQLLRRLVKRLRENRYLILMDSLEYLLTGNEEDGWGILLMSGGVSFLSVSWQNHLVKVVSFLPLRICQLSLRQPNAIATKISGIANF
jgi:hypothetical protein